MKCQGCEEEIEIFKPPFGAYFCKKNHAHCGACDLSATHCLICGGDVETKYKSPHFASEKDSDELEVPAVSTIDHSNEEEEMFKKLRESFLNGHINEKLFFRGYGDLNIMRTLSAIIAKDLYPIEAKDVGSDLRYRKIMHTLRETGCPSDHSNESENEESDNAKKTEEEIKIQSQMTVLFPHHSSKKPSGVKQKMSHCFSVVRTSSETKLRTEVCKTEVCKTNLITSDSSTLSFHDFKTVSCINFVEEHPTGFPITIEEESLDCHPFYCPISGCVWKLFISNFNQHIVHDHRLLPICQIKFGEFRELNIDLSLCTRTPHSVACFFMQNIVENYSSPPVKDFLPMLLMIGRYQFKEKEKTTALCRPNDQAWTHFEYFVIWLMGVVPEQCEITVYVSAFGKDNFTFSRWSVDDLNPIQNFSNMDAVYQSARRIVLSYRELRFLTNNFQDNLQCHVGLVNYAKKGNNNNENHKE